MSNIKTKKTIITELLDADTMTYKKGADYGNGAPATSGEISSPGTTDVISQLVSQKPNWLNNGVGFTQSYLEEEMAVGNLFLEETFNNLDEAVPYGTHDEMRRKYSLRDQTDHSITEIPNIGAVQSEQLKQGLSRFLKGFMEADKSDKLAVLGLILSAVDGRLPALPNNIRMELINRLRSSFKFTNPMDKPTHAPEIASKQGDQPWQPGGQPNPSQAAA